MNEDDDGGGCVAGNMKNMNRERILSVRLRRRRRRRCRDLMM